MEQPRFSVTRRVGVVGQLTRKPRVVEQYAVIDAGYRDVVPDPALHVDALMDCQIAVGHIAYTIYFFSIHVVDVAVVVVVTST